MDVVSLKLARNYTNEKLNSLPSNAPTKTVTFDGGIYSVGNDVVNGQVSDVVVKGLTVTNLLEDGEVLRVLPPRPGSGIAPVFFDNLNLPQDKYLIFYELVQTVETFDLNTPYYNIISVTTTDPDHKTKNNTVGRKVWKLDAPETITKIGWRVYETESEVHVKNFMVVKATEKDWNLTEDELIQKYNWHNGTKSTNSVRIRSVNEDETKESIVYVNLPQGEELRSLPNGVKDEVSVSEGKLIKRVSDEFILPMSGWTFGFINEQGFVVLINYTTLPNFARQEYGYFIPTTGMVVNNSNLPAYTTTSYAAIRANANTECIATSYIDGTYLYIVVHQDNYNKTQDDAGANAWVNENMQGVTLNYQLAQPIITKLPAQPPLQVYENGTVYVEPLGDPSETTLPTVELTVPIAGGNKVGIATHDYAGAAADWVLTSNESKCKSLLVTNAGGSANIIAPDKPGLTFTINNKSGQAITIKKSGGTGVTVTAGKKVTVQHFGTDYEAISPEI